jgi:cellulose synthase/poly-beta-1,6-N-acetylglucosamine synthase-like glycosyltransferase
MLRVVAWVPQVFLVVLVAYTLITAVAGWRQPARAPRGQRSRRFVVVIPAHDEATVIAAVVGDLMGSDYPRDCCDVWVIADRCTDGTASQATAAGASVFQRSRGEPGKGAALADFLAAHPLDPDQALVVFDADNRVPPELLGRLADEIDAGARVIQAYLDTTRPGESWVTLATALSYWAGNRMVQAARANLGWPVDLGGTGMCITATALDQVGGFSGSLVEDQDLAARLTLADIPITWMHDVRVRDEKPATAAVVVRQRARWAAGRRAVASRHAGRLLRQGIGRRNWGTIDSALRLVQPSRTFVAFVSAGLAVAAATTGSSLLLPAVVWIAIAAAQFVAPIPFLIRDGVPLRWVVRYPALVGLALLWLPIQLVSRRVGSWVRTPHRGESPDEPPPRQ